MSEERTCSLCCLPATWQSPTYKTLVFCNAECQRLFEEAMDAAPKRSSDEDDSAGRYDPFD